MWRALTSDHRPSSLCSVALALILSVGVSANEACRMPSIYRKAGVEPRPRNSEIGDSSEKLDSV